MKIKKIFHPSSLLVLCLILFSHNALADSQAISDSSAKILLSSETDTKNKNLCFGDPDNIKKDFSMEAFDKVVGKNNSKMVLDWLNADFYLQSFDDLKFGGKLICRLLEQEQQDKIKPHFLLIQPVAGATEVVHFTVANNTISQINAYMAYPYEKYIYDKSGKIYLLTLLEDDITTSNEYSFRYSLYDVSKMYGKVFTISQLREELNNTGMFSLPYDLYQEPDISILDGRRINKNKNCPEDNEISSQQDIIATIDNKVIYEDLNADGYPDFILSYKEENCKTKQISHHIKTFLSTEDGFKGKP
jgi:hypothetical protein